LASEQRGAFAASSRGDSQRAYRRALRHSRLVRFLRVALIGVVIIALSAVVADNYLPVAGLRLPGEIGKLVIKGSTLIMQSPRLTGFTSDLRPYEFTADSAQQIITRPEIVDLQQLKAKIQMADKSTVHLRADSGVYNMKTEFLTLDDNIYLVSTTGYEARLKHAVVDMSKGNVVSDTPVWVKLHDGDLNAKGLKITDNGNVLHFNDVTMVLQGKHNLKTAQP
jgi:lipopolysaccharide export system protein LptC